MKRTRLGGMAVRQFSMESIRSLLITRFGHRSVHDVGRLKNPTSRCSMSIQGELEARKPSVSSRSKHWKWYLVDQDKVSTGVAHCGWQQDSGMSVKYLSSRYSPV